MYMRDVWRACLRRGYLVLVCLAVSLAVLVSAGTAIKPDYELTADIVLIPPPNPDTPDLNRFLGLGGLGDTVDVLARSMASQETAESLDDAAPGADYTVLPDPTSSAPLLVVTVTDTDERTARTMLAAVLDQLPQNLGELQSDLGIEQDSQITAMAVARDEEPETQQRSRLRTLAVIAAALLLASLLVVAGVDGMLLRSSSRPDEEAPVADVPPEDPPEEPSVAEPEPVPASRGVRL